MFLEVQTHHKDTARPPKDHKHLETCLKPGTNTKVTSYFAGGLLGAGPDLMVDFLNASVLYKIRQLDVPKYGCQPSSTSRHMYFKPEDDRSKAWPQDGPGTYMTLLNDRF